MAASSLFDWLKASHLRLNKIRLIIKAGHCPVFTVPSESMVVMVMMVMEITGGVVTVFHSGI